MNGTDLLGDYIAYIATAAAIGFAFTNLIKMGGEIPSWMKPVSAYIVAFIGLTCFIFFREGYLTLQMVAGNVVFAGLAMGGSVALHELDGRGRQAESNRLAEEYLQRGTPIRKVD